MSKAFSYIVLHVACSLNEGGELVVETEEVRDMGSFGSSHSDPRGSVVRVSFRDNSQGMPLRIWRRSSTRFARLKALAHAWVSP